MPVVRSVRIQVAWLLVVAALPASAQTAVIVRPTPLPDHKTRVTTTQELSIAATGMAAAGPGKLVIDSKGALEFTRTNGAVDDQGQMDAQITVERFEMSYSIGGQPGQARDTSAIVGRSLTALFDRTGRLADVKAPAELSQVSSIVRELLNGIYGLTASLPETPMKVGDTVTAPGGIPLRLPGAAAAAALQTRSVVTLRRVESRPAGRIAFLDQRIESDAPGGEFSVSGGGTIEVNLDKGFVAASVMNWTFAGTMRPAGGAGPVAPQSAQVLATYTMTLAATEAS